MREGLKRFIELVERDKLGRWVAVGLIATAAAVLEAVGALLVLSLLGAITDVGEGVDLPIIGDLGHFFPGSTPTQVFVYTLVVVGVFFVVRAIFLLLQTYIQQRMVQNAGLRLSARLYRGYIRMPYAFHLRRNSAQLIRNTYESVERIVGDVYMSAVGLISQSLIILGLLVVLTVTSPLGTGLAVLVMSPLILIVLRVLHPRLKGLGVTNQVATRDTIQTLQQSLQGIREIQLFGREAFFDRYYWRIRETLARIHYRRSLLSDIPRVAFETALVLFILAFLGLRVAQGHDIEGAIPILGLFTYTALRLMPMLNNLVSNINSLRYGSPNVEELYADLRSIEEQAKEESATDEVMPFVDALELGGVTFSYEQTDEPAIRDVTLRILRGESIGIVGPTGGGKTTLTDLISGLLEPTGGSVLVDGVDIRSDLAAWQRNLGMVPQTIFLLDDSIRRNIGFGLDDSEIDDERVRASVEMAQLRSFIDSLPEGLDAIVGERGVRISGGQRQRIAIARALYREPQVLLFDEGTSSLDNLTEEALLGALEHLRGHRTLITVAHRLTTVRSCDRVVMVADGLITDEGTYEELSARHAEFGLHSGHADGAS